MRTAAVVAAVFILSACPGGEPKNVSQSGPAASSTSSTVNNNANPENSTSMNPVTPPQKELPGSRIAGGAPPPQSVHLIEYAIHMPDTLSAGQVRFSIENGGKENHNFAIEGPGVATKLSSDLSRGNKGELAVTLQPGTYTVYCPVDGHRGKGMETKITVK
jgi:hypothetical protein